MSRDFSPILSIDNDLKAKLRAQPLNGELWVKLAEFYRMSKRDFFRAEICYQAALYHDMENQDLVSRWLGVFSHNRLYKTPADVQASAKIIERAFLEDLQHPERVLNQMIFSLDCLDNPKMATVCL